VPDQNYSNRDLLLGLATIALVTVCLTAVVITWLVTR
jgi:hypothetical protein